MVSSLCIILKLVIFCYSILIVSKEVQTVRIALIFGTVAALLQPLSGDRSAKNIAKLQLAKLAAVVTGLGLKYL